MVFSEGRLTVGVLLLASVCVACAGRSERFQGDDGSGGDELGGTSGSGASSGNGAGGSSGNSAGGAIGVGGTSSGGVTFGGTGAGAVSGSSGTAGVGGSAQCGGCPLADYGLVIEGDGSPYEMHFNGNISLDESEARPGDPVACPVEVLRGSAGGCSRSITLFACEDPVNGPPCLEVTGRTARYVDRATGRLWDGIVLADLANPSVAGVVSGGLALEFTSGNIQLSLKVTYTFCTAGVMLDIVCAPP